MVAGVALALLAVASWILVVEVALLLWRDRQAARRGQRRIELAESAELLTGALEEELRKVRKAVADGREHPFDIESQRVAR